jgi:hypothetical protein
MGNEPFGQKTYAPEALIKKIKFAIKNYIWIVARDTSKNEFSVCI